MILLSALFLATALSPEVDEIRKPTHKIEPMILNRWSPRAMSGVSMSDEELLPLFEAARWAPSSYNNQPWRFLYAKRGTPQWNRFFELLVPFNQEWCKNASALVVIVSKETFDHNGKLCPTHSFDTGAAWMAMALEGASRGLVVHGMGGFDYEKAKTVLQIPEGYTVEAMAAIGKRGSKSLLPDHLQKSEVPSRRKPLDQIAFEGMFENEKRASPALAR